MSDRITLKALASWTSHAFAEEVTKGDTFEASPARARDLIEDGRAEKKKTRKKSTKADVTSAKAASE